MLRPRRRPLVRAAMMGGAGYAAGRHAARAGQREADQEQRLESLEQQQAPAPPPPPAAPAAAGGQDVVSRLTELKGLLDAGALTPEQFEAAKRQVLQGS